MSSPQWGPIWIGTDSDQFGALLSGALAQRREVATDKSDGLGESLPGAGAELDLPSGLDGQQAIKAAVRQSGKKSGIAVLREMRREAVRTVGIGNQKFEFNAEPARWPILEAGPGNPCLGGSLGQSGLHLGQGGV